MKKTNLISLTTGAVLLALLIPIFSQGQEELVSPTSDQDLSLSEDDPLDGEMFGNLLGQKKTFELDKQEAVDGIDGYLEAIDDLIPRLEILGAGDDIDKLEEAQDLLLEYKNKILSVDPIAIGPMMHNFSMAFAPLSDNLGSVRAKLDLPEVFHEFSLALQDIKKSVAVKDLPSSFESFYQASLKQDQTVQAMSAKQKYQEGSLLIAQFADDNGESFKAIITEKGWPKVEGMDRLKKAAAQALVLDPLPPAPPLKPDGMNVREKTSLINPKALVIIVNSWRKKDANIFTKLANKASFEKRLKSVETDFKDISYDQLDWQFEICMVEGDNKLFPRPNTSLELFQSAILQCKIETKRGGDYMSAFSTVIVYPGISSPNGKKAAGYATPVISHDEWDDHYFCGVSVTMSDFSPGTLEHELGHCLGLSHAGSYNCGTDVYNKACLAGYEEYGDFYDIMGNSVYFNNDHWNGEETYNAFFPKGPPPNLNCRYKHYLLWQKTQPVGEGKYPISALEYPLTNFPKCIGVPVNRVLEGRLENNQAPCAEIYIEFRTPRKSVTDDNFGGLALHCANQILPSNTYGVPDTYNSPLVAQTELLDCAPNSNSGFNWYDGRFPDSWDGFVSSGEYCHTGLGWDVGFQADKNQKDRVGEVAIVSTICPDADKDGFYDKDYEYQGLDGKKHKCDFPDPAHPECSDPSDVSAFHTPKNNPDPCNGKDDNCDGMIDWYKDAEGGRGLSTCGFCSDTESGWAIAYNLKNYLIAGKVLGYRGATSPKDSLQNLSFEIPDKCVVHNNDQKHYLEEQFCRPNPPNANPVLEIMPDTDAQPFDCRAYGTDHICKDGACIKDSNCVPEVCDGKDNNCDNMVDNGITPQPTTCGVGACAATGTTTCVNGVAGNTCTPGKPSPELCGDWEDNDCNDKINDGCPEICGDNIDNNGNGFVEENCQFCREATPEYGKVAVTRHDAQGKPYTYYFSDVCSCQGAIGEGTCGTHMVCVNNEVAFGPFLPCFGKNACQDPDGNRVEGLYQTQQGDNICLFYNGAPPFCLGYNSGAYANQAATCQ